MAARSTKARPGTGGRVATDAPWPLLERTQVAESIVSSAKRGADDNLRVRKAVQASDDLMETIEILERLRVPCDELGGPAALETFPEIPPPPPVVGSPLDWWESHERSSWESILNRASNRLEDITKAGWKAFIEAHHPTIPSEQILSNLEVASSELKRECASIRKLIATWETLARKRLPEKGDAATAERTAAAIEQSWQTLEDAGGAPERLDLLTKLSTQPPTITLADLSEEDWEWLLETELAGSVYLSIWED